MNRCNLWCVVYALFSLVLYNQARTKTPNECFQATEERYRTCSGVICTKDVVTCANDQGKLTENECRDKLGYRHDCRTVDCVPEGEGFDKWFTCTNPPPAIKVKVNHDDQEKPLELEVYSASGKINGSRFWDRLVDKLLADHYPQIRNLSIQVVAIYTDVNHTVRIENSPIEYDIPNEVYLDTTTGVKTIDVIMEAKIPVGAFARPNDIFRLFMENEYTLKMKVLRGNGSNVDFEKNTLVSTAHMDKIEKKEKLTYY
ncbi:hypothetical protein Ddc_15432 [Ditylenchus destructor]|nr:hypothetical protein Ddc_15432 [Ditylenchus destructor]